ncbi:MAG TPA: TatD family hydrolase [Candidatus Acidoferrum sp.]|nr:TatD family hydrolase [Candidatus Acidoferrum sp.]
MLQLTDSHCHIQDADPAFIDASPMGGMWLRAEHPNPDDMITHAAENGVTSMICVGTTVADSVAAAQFVQNRPNCWASIGLHPHEAVDEDAALAVFRGLLKVGDNAGGAVSGTPNFVSRVPAVGRVFEQDKIWNDEAQGFLADKIIAIGECGLDYHYDHADPAAQQQALRAQIELALAHNLPLIFHVRDAFDDFWPIFDSYQNIRGVLHSFTDTQDNLDKALARGLYIGQNGIVTFTKNKWQRDVAKNIPLDRLLLETDAPFLTPHPLRGRINEPANVRLVAEFLAELRQQSVEEIGKATTQNARYLFAI